MKSKIIQIIIVRPTKTLVQWIHFFLELVAQLKNKKKYKTCKMLMAPDEVPLFFKTHSVFGQHKKLATSWYFVQMCGSWLIENANLWKCILKNESDSICAHISPSWGFYITAGNFVPNLVFQVQSETIKIFLAYCGFIFSNNLGEFWTRRKARNLWTRRNFNFQP